VAQAPQSILHSRSTEAESIAGESLGIVTLLDGDVTAIGVAAIEVKPHIFSVITGRGFGLLSPESQCSEDFPAQHGIDFSADVLTGNSVTANELRMKTARNRLTNERVNERRRSLCKLNLIDPQV